jgi:hypothetical protein
MYDERNYEIDWKNESEGEDGGKMKGIKSLAFPYVATPSFTSLAIMNLHIQPHLIRGEVDLTSHGVHLLGYSSLGFMYQSSSLFFSYKFFLLE